MQLAKSEDMQQANMRRIMQENVTLLAEINELRRELSQSKSSVHSLEATLRTTRKLAAARGDTSLYSAPKMTGTLSLAATEDANQTERIIEMQKDEIRRLRDVIEGSSRPSSVPRLPSIGTPIQ